MTFDAFKTNATALANEGGLTGKEKASFLISALQIFMQAEAEIEKTNLLIAAEAPVKTAQTALLNQQKLTEIERTEQEAYRNTVLMVDEHFKNLGQTTLAEKQTLLAVRQTSAFDDKQKTDKAKMAQELAGSIFIGGGTAPVETWTWSKGLVDAIQCNS